MRNIIDNWLLNIILLFTIIGEFFIPWVLERFYAEYNGKRMVMSALGNPQSPVGLFIIYGLSGLEVSLHLQQLSISYQ